MLGCGDRKAEKTEAAVTVEESPAPASEPVHASATNPITAPLTVDDIGRWEKGMAGELKAEPWLGGIDTTMRSPAQREEMRTNNEAGIQRMQAEVPPESRGGNETLGH